MNDCQKARVNDDPISRLLHTKYLAALLRGEARIAAPKQEETELLSYLFFLQDGENGAQGDHWEQAQMMLRANALCAALGSSSPQTS